MSKEATFQDFSVGLLPDGQDLWRWLYVELRAAILDGRLKAGARMPATRSLASQYSVSRGTVVTAFEQLQSEGYTHTKVGSGTYVVLEVIGRSVSEMGTPDLPSGFRQSRASLSKWAQRYVRNTGVMPAPLTTTRPSVNFRIADSPRNSHLFKITRPRAEVAMFRSFRVAIVMALVTAFSANSCRAQDEEKMAVENIVRNYEHACQEFDFEKANPMLAPGARWIEDSYPEPAQFNGTGWSKRWQEYKAAKLRIDYKMRDLATTIRGEVAWATLTLDTTMTAGNEVALALNENQREWKGTFVESYVLEKTNAGWKIALAHTSLLTPHSAESEKTHHRPRAQKAELLQDEVWQREQQYFQFLQRKDLKGFMSLWDVKFMGWPDYAEHPLGKADMEEVMRKEFETPQASVPLRPPAAPEGDEVFGDIAITYYLWPHANDTDPSKYRVSHTWQKGPQGWQIIGGMSCEVSSVVPLQQKVTSVNEHSQSAEGEISAIRGREEAFRLAQLNYDVRAANGIIAEEFVGTWNHGEQASKEQFVSLIGNKVDPLELLEYGDLDIRLYRETAVVLSTIHEKARYGGKTDEYRGRRTAVWIKHGSQWQLVTIHTSGFARDGTGGT